MNPNVIYQGFCYLLIFTIFQNVLTVFLVRRQRRKEELRSNKAVSASLSVLVPIKGPYEGLEENLRSFFEQRYRGTVEWVFAFQDPLDSCIPVVKEFSSRMQVPRVKVLEGVQFLGLNPKNSNLTHAFRAATGDWLLTIDIDCFLPPDFLQSMMDQTMDDTNKVVTTVPIHYGAKNLWSCLESIGTNVEMMNYFVSSYSFRSSGLPVYGGGLLFHRKTGLAAGAFGDTYLNSLTEDAWLQGQFQRLGSEVNLANVPVRTLLDHQTWSGYSKRYVRWLMIGKYFIPSLFYVTPIFWFPHWTLLTGLTTCHAGTLKLAAAFYLLRVLYACAMQWALSVPRRDILKGATIFVYDVLMPYVWLSALMKRSVVWAGTTMAVKAKGRLVKR